MSKVFISQETQNWMVAFFMKTSAPRILEHRKKEAEKFEHQSKRLAITAKENEITNA